VGLGQAANAEVRWGAEVVEDALDRLALVNHGDDLAPAAALAACQDVNGEGSLE